MEDLLTKASARTGTHTGSRLIWLALFGFLVLSIAFVAVPVFLIQPFRPQTQRALEVSYLLRAWSPLATVIIHRHYARGRVCVGAMAMETRSSLVA